MPTRLHETKKRIAPTSVYTNAQLALLFATIASSFALLVNWNGTPDRLVVGICGGSAVVLLVLSLIRRK